MGKTFTCSRKVECNNFSWSNLILIYTFRWGHLNVLTFLLENVAFSQQDLKKAFKAAEKPLLREAIEKYHFQKYKKRIRSFFFCECW